MLFQRIWYLLNLRRKERELEEEISAHRERLTAEQLRQFGSTLRLREESRDAWGWTWLFSLFQDLKLGVRILSRAPGFALTVIGVLALGMAVAITGFTLFNIIVLQKLPVRDPDSLCVLRCGGSTWLSYPEFRYLRDNNRVFSAVFAIGWGELQFGSERDAPVRARFVSENFFRELGIRPAWGRLPAGSTEASEALLSYAFWQRRLGADPAIVGRTIHLNRVPVTVAGVAPYDFAGLDMESADLWLPVEQHALYYPGSDLLTAENRRPVQVYGRLRPGLGVSTARAGLEPLWDLWHREHAAAASRREGLEVVAAGHLGRFGESSYGSVAFLTALVFVVLAISATNAGTLQIVRAAARQHEMRIRVSLGAGRLRLIRQLLTEALVISAASCGVGLLLGCVAGNAILRSLDLPFNIQSALDTRLVFFTAGLTLLASLLFGLAPALQLSQGRQHATRFRSLLVGAQVAASSVLLIIAGLYLHALQRVTTTPAGFEFRDVVAVDPALYDLGYSPDAARIKMRLLLDAAQKVPGVRGAALCLITPFGQRQWRQEVRDASGAVVQTYANAVNAEFFSTLKIPILRGRVFREAERDALIVSQSLAGRLWPGEDPVGKRLKDGVVVGVAGNARTLTLDPAASEMYFSLAGQAAAASSSVLLVRTAGPPAAFIPALRVVLSAANEPAPGFDSLAALFEQRIEATRKGSGVIGAVGLLTLALAAIGIAGVLSYAVSQRTREIGIRVAIGATARDIALSVLRQCAGPFGLGLVCGSFGGAAMSTLLGSQLFGLSRLDPAVYCGTAIMLTATGMLAALAPVLRALRIHPAAALRDSYGGRLV